MSILYVTFTVVVEKILKPFASVGRLSLIIIED